MNRMTFRGGGRNEMAVPGGPLGKARMALANGRPDEAERLSRKRLERQPDDSMARLVLSQALLQQRQVDEAVKEARRVTREQPNNADGHLTLAAALMQQGRVRVPAEAEKEARRAVQLQPKVARARVQLAEVLVANDNLPGAREEAENAIKLEPRGSAGYFIKAFVALRDKDYEGAIAASDSAIRFDREHMLGQAEIIRARALIEVKRYDEALAGIGAAEKQNPALGGANAEAMRGTIFFRQRKYRQSYQAYLAAQRASGRSRFAPVGAFIGMIYSPFGDNAQYAILVTVLVILALILFGVSFIPVAGQWISAALIIAIVGVVAFAALRFGTGRFLPADRNEWPAVIAATGIAFLLAPFILVVIEHSVQGIFQHNPSWSALVNPTNVGVIGCVALAAAAGTAYGFPLLLARLNQRQARLTAAG